MPRSALIGSIVVAFATQAAFDGTLTFCGVTGELVPGCDCPGPETAALEPIDCCVHVESSRPGEGVVRRSREEAPRRVLVAIVPGSSPLQQRAPARASPVHDGDPPHPGRLFLRLRTLVI
ncbi:MAG: hypothetical protein JNK82_34210 [Myxococcaceae bacterium]|nr:hypothetical protein [Myxococcaceae bacterium]